MGQRSVPSNLTDRTRLLAVLSGDMLNVEVGPRNAALPLEKAVPFREFAAWQGKRNYEGRHWSSTVNAHVVFESLLERDYLLGADFDPGIVALSAQPFALLWPRDTVDSDGTAMRWHVPDFFVRLTNGDGRVVDVRDAGRLDDGQFELTAQACAEVGWQYEVFSGLDPVVSANLKWLGGYRMPRHSPTSDIREGILRLTARPRPLQWVVESAARDAQASAATAHAGVLHMLFHGELVADMRTPLSMDSPVSVAHMEVLA